MANNVWSDLHENYKKQDWIDKPSIFAETAIEYFPKEGRVLELGAGQGQDSRFFADRGYDVVSTDFEAAALEQNEFKTPDNLKQKIIIQKVDMCEDIPFEDESFDVVYAHLSLHYFDKDQTQKVFSEIERILKPGGIFAFFVNSVHDPEYNTSEKIEDGYFLVGETRKRYFSMDAAREFARSFEVMLLDDNGETYKDRAKGVHNLVRFIGSKPKGSN